MWLPSGEIQLRWHQAGRHQHVPSSGLQIPNAKVLFNSSTGQLHLQARKVQLYRYSNALGLRTLLGYAYMDASSSDEDLMRIVTEAH